MLYWSWCRDSSFDYLNKCTGTVLVLSIRIHQRLAHCTLPDHQKDHTMKTLFDKESLTIQAGQVVSGIAPCEHILRVTRGLVWLTVEGLPEDYWLHAGQTFRLSPGLLVVIEADQQACIETRSEDVGAAGATSRKSPLLQA
jgi:hypothetical protein